MTHTTPPTDPPTNLIHFEELERGNDITSSDGNWRRSKNSAFNHYTSQSRSEVIDTVGRKGGRDAAETLRGHASPLPIAIAATNNAVVVAVCLALCWYAGTWYMKSFTP